MKAEYKQKIAGIFAAIVVVCVGLVLLGHDTVNAAGSGSITGTVKLNGTPPHMRGIDMSKDPYCSKAHASDPAMMETVVVGKDQGLRNVVLYISQGLSAADAGQDFKVTTSDQTAHNIHPQPNPMTGNIPWNRSQPPGAPPIVQSWKSEEVTIPVKCNIHPWMHGWFVVVKGPYATTDANGSYTIHGVPPGSYTVTAWQEELGTQTAKVTVAGGQSATADFTFKGK